MRGPFLGALAITVIVVALRFGSFVAGGSDSYCYVHQAERWAAVLSHPFTETLQPVEPLALVAPWPEASATFAPTGHIASPTTPGAHVPICPAGLSLVMAPLLLAGGPSLMFATVPLFGALLVGAAYALGARYGTRIGVAAACLTAASPTFLYQVVQPMSDVPAAALWIAAVVAVTGTRPRSPLVAGVLTSAAILMRPNLVPLGFVLGLYLLVRPERSWRVRVDAAVAYALASAPGCLIVGAIQWSLYGSPLSSGYASFDVLFSVGHVIPNLRYFGWLWESYAVVLVLAIAALALVPGHLTWLLVALVATNIALYLPYTVFEDWMFMRFLLPAIPLLIVLGVAAADSLLVRLFARRDRTTPPLAVAPLARAVILGVLVAALASVFVRDARRHSAFLLQAYEARFAAAGTFVGRRLPENALVITSYESGSVRFYSGRKTLVWSALDPGKLDEALAFVRARGFEPFLLFEGFEEPDFRERFARESAVGALDWPPIAEVASQVRIYRPGDRARYLNGEAIPTEYAR